MSTKTRDQLLGAVRREIDRHVDLAVQAFGEELQARRPGMLDDAVADAAKLRGELYASVALRVAAATSEPEILASARERIGLFIPLDRIDGWIRKGTETRG